MLYCSFCFLFVRDAPNLVFVAGGIWKLDPEKHVLVGKKVREICTSQTYSYTTHLVVVIAFVVVFCFFMRQILSDEQDYWLSYLKHTGFDNSLSNKYFPERRYEISNRKLKKKYGKESPKNIKVGKKI